MVPKNRYRKLFIPIVFSAIGAVAGFITFLITGQIIFLIAFVTLGLTLGLVLTDPGSEFRDRDKQE